MSAPKTQTANINLLSKDAFSRSKVGQILNWSLSTGRYIVVFTEMVVILTFLSRFTLDRQLTNLNDSIASKAAILESLSEFETKARTIQTKAKFLDQPARQSPSPQLFSYLASVGQNIIFKESAVVRDKLSIEGETSSQNDLSVFVETLKLNPNFSNISLDKIETSTQTSGLKFSLRATISQDAKTFN